MRFNESCLLCVFIQSQILLSEFYSNLLETLLCTKSKQTVRIEHCSSCSFPLICCSWMFKALFSAIYVQSTFHREGNRRADQQPTAHVGRRLDADIRKLKYTYQQSSVHKLYKFLCRYQGRSQELNVLRSHMQ